MGDTSSSSEIVTVTSEGQITLPMSVRNALNLKKGGQVVFEARGAEMIMSIPEANDDPAITALLALIEADIAAGRNTTSLPDDLALAMIESARKHAPANQEIEGDVAL